MAVNIRRHTSLGITMTEPVYIEGFSSDAISQLPKWASESTLAEILRVLKQQLSLTSQHQQRLEASLRNFTGNGAAGPGNPATVDPSLIGEVNDELRESLRLGGEEANQHNQRRRQWRQGNQQHTTTSALFTRMTRSGNALNLTLGGLDTVAAFGIAAMKANIDGFTELYRAGVSVVDASTGITDGFMSLQNIVLLSGIRLRVLEGIIKKYANTVSVYGTQKFIKATVMSQKSLYMLGYSASEAAEYTASYIDSIKGFVDVADISEERISKSAIRFAASVRDMSLLTGQSVEELMGKFGSLAKSTDAFILNSQVGVGATENILAFTASLKDQNVAAQLLSTITSPIKEIDQTVNSLLSSGQGAIAQQYKEFIGRIKASADSGASSTELMQMYREFGNNIRVSANEVQNLQLQNTESARATLSIINSAQQASRDIAKLDEKKRNELAADTEAQKARNKIADEWNKIVSSLSAIFMPTAPLLEFFGSGLEIVANGVGYIADMFQGSLIPSIFAISGAIVGGLLSLRTAFSFISNLFGGGPPQQSMISKIIEFLKTSAVRLWGAISSAVSSILPRIWSFLAPLMAPIGSFIASIVTKIGAIGAAFSAGYAIGSALSYLLSKFEWFNNSLDSVFSMLDRVIQYVPGQVGSDARDRIESKKRLAEIENTYINNNTSSNQVNNSRTLVEPQRTPIQPVIVQQISQGQTTGTDLSGNAGTPSIVPTTSEPPVETEVNMLLKYQNSLLERLVDKQTEAVGTSRELLKTARNS